jgi:hypothetical protein
MDAELAELLKLATAAYAEHGDKQIYFVVHEVELSGKTVDHDISPYGCSHQEGGGVVVEVGNQRCGPSIYSHHDAESERQQFRQLAQVCGAWLTANGRIDFSPLPSPIGRWCLELLKLPTIHREHRKSVWYCNAFGATLIVLRLVAAERQVNSGVGPTFQSVSEVNESGKSNQRESVVTEQRRSDEGAVASGNKTDRSEPSESLRQGYDDRGNYWRNACSTLPTQFGKPSSRLPSITVGRCFREKSAGPSLRAIPPIELPVRRLWHALSTREQVRVVELRVETVAHDGRDGTLATSFRSVGITEEPVA